MAEGMELWAVIITALAAVGGLVFNAFTQQHNTAALRAQYWLQLREFMTRYDP